MTHWAPGDYGIINARASLPEDQQPHSIDTQVAMGARILGDLGLPLGTDGLYVDRISRSLWPRDVMDDLLIRVADPHCRVVATWASDRMYGDVTQQVAIWRGLETTGTQLHDLNGAFALDDEGAQLLASMMALLSQTEVRRTRRRVHDTHLEKFRHGKIVQKPPFGFEVVDGRFAIDEDELAVARSVFRWAADEHLGIADIAQRVAALGVRTSKGTTWTAVNISRLIRNPWYAGEMVWNQRKSVWDGPKKTIVKRPESEWVRMPTPFGCVLDDDPVTGLDLWARANAQLDRGAQAWNRKNRKHAARRLAGLLVCGRCGRRMYAFARYRRNAAGNLPDTWEWRCAYSNQPGVRCATPHTMSERKIVKELRAWVLADAGDSTVEVRVEVDPAVKVEMRMLAKNVAEAEAAIKNAKRQLIRERISEEDYDGLVDEETKDRDSAAARLSALQDLASSTPAAVAAVAARTRAALRPVFDALVDDDAVGNAEEAGSVLRGSFKEIRVNNPKITRIVVL